MMNTAKRAWHVLSTVLTILGMSMAASAQDPTPPTNAPKPQPTNKYIIRGCLNGSTLTQVEPPPPPLKLPQTLRVASPQTIRDQVKALSGHQVELTGALFGVPGAEEGVLIGDSGSARVYVGGGDPNLGQDLVVNRNDPPTIRAMMIKDLAPTCVPTPDPMVGMWTLNVEKSTTTFKSGTSIIESTGDGLKATVDIVTTDGTPYHWTWTAKYDGRDNPVMGASPYGSGTHEIALTRIDPRTIRIVTKHDGQVTITQTLVVSADGKTRTTTTTGKDAKGQPVQSTAISEKR
jgi:hypothetical protein